mgnify:CR=1 FL=1
MRAVSRTFGEKVCFYCYNRKAHYAAQAAQYIWYESVSGKQDIYLVADVLGHKDVNTTRRHYAEIVDENKRNARNIVHLRRD